VSPHDGSSVVFEIEGDVELWVVEILEVGLRVVVAVVHFLNFKLLKILCLILKGWKSTD
jgi:hypothetical protein